MRVVAVIPARGGSKGVPGKNLRPVGGVSLVARAVTAAVRSSLIDDVFVSTDDSAIAGAARDAGAHTVERPVALSGDTASSEAALLHALETVDADILVFIQATSPFIDPADLDAAVARVRDDDADVVFSVVRSHVFLWRDTELGAQGINHDASVRLRRQDSEPQFRETGAFYVMRADGFVKARHRFFGRIGVAIVPDLTAIEIDSEDDLALANSLVPLLTITEESWSPSA